MDQGARKEGRLKSAAPVEDHTRVDAEAQIKKMFLRLLNGEKHTPLQAMALVLAFIGFYGFQVTRQRVYEICRKAYFSLKNPPKSWPPF